MNKNSVRWEFSPRTSFSRRRILGHEVAGQSTDLLTGFF